MENLIDNLFDSCEQESINEILSLIKTYDVYDFISRLSSLNLNLENQNKAPLIDYIVALLLSKKVSDYPSKSIMSHGKFRYVISKINNLYIKYSIDPAENLFSEIVTLTKNYRVLNGINISPAYNLQLLIDVLFNYQNDYNRSFVDKALLFTITVLEISDIIINNSYDLKSSNFPSESQEIFIPDANTIKINSKVINIDKNSIDIFNILFNDNFFIEFGEFDIGSSNNYNFFNRPFLYNPNNNKVIVLNASLLPYFIISKLLLLAESYSLKEEVIKRLNEYSFRECRKRLSSMGHKKIMEADLGIELVNTPYYKENLLSLYNNELLLLQFICDDGFDYNYNDMFFYYSDHRHSSIIEERFKYFTNRLTNKADGFYTVIVYNSIGRGFDISLGYDNLKYEPLFISSFELMCIEINERKETWFLPKYIQAKSSLNFAPSLYGEISIVSMYTSNDYSFYIDDDTNPRLYNLYFASGDVLNYINKAISTENRHLVKSYIPQWYTRIKCKNKIRHIYTEEESLDNQRLTLCLELDSTVIWFTTERINSIPQMEILWHLIDLFSYWLSELEKLINTIDIYKDLLQININLVDSIEKYTMIIEDDQKDEQYNLYVDKDDVIQLAFSANDYTKLNCDTNYIEKLYVKQLFDLIINSFAEIKTYNENDFNIVFENPKKKKVYAFLLDENPYYYPIKVRYDRKIQKQDEDYLLDIIGEQMMKKYNWEIGSVPMEHTTVFFNQVVELLFNMLEEQVKKLNPHNLVEIIYEDLEETLYKIKITEKRYASDILCYPESQQDSINYVNDLNRTSIALKFLMEYVAAQPPMGKEMLGIGNYEFILSICSILIEWAYKNDLYFYDIFKTPVKILKSGRICIKREKLEELSDITSKFRNEQMFSNSLGTKKVSFEINKDKYIPELDEAFISCFGYSLQQFNIFIFSMIELCKQSENSNSVCTMKRNQIIKILETQTQLNVNVIIKILEALSLEKREKYLMEPKDEIYPWRFNRSFSFLRRPIIVRDNDCIFASRNLYQTYLYTIDLVFSGKLKTKDERMKKLIGKISNERGKLFNDSVVNCLRDIKEFRVYENVKKINKKKIEFEKGRFLGDIDALIIDSDKHIIYVAEVKQFNFSRNPYEIHQEYSKMFDDSSQKKSFVFKHNLRVQWVRENINELKIQYNLVETSWKVIGLFIVDEFLISPKAYNKSINFITYDKLTLSNIRKIKK